MSKRAWNRSLLLASLIAVAISVVSVGLEWSTSEQLELKLSLLTLALVLGTAVVSYFLRVIRFYFLLSRSGVPISLPNTAVAQAVGFALSVTPGSVGDLFKLHLIQERAGTSMAQTAPVLVIDRVMEGAGFLILAFVSTAALPSLPIHLPDTTLLATVLGSGLLLVLFHRRLGQLVTPLQRLFAKLPLGARLLPQMQNLWHGIRSNLTPRQLVTGLSLTALARVTDGLVLLLAAQMLGVTLALPVAIFVIAASGFAGGVSLLPGGAGATETMMAGLLVFSGAPFPNALAITLLARMSTLWLWVGLGLGLTFIMQFASARVPAYAPNQTLR